VAPATLAACSSIRRTLAAVSAAISTGHPLTLRSVLMAASRSSSDLRCASSALARRELSQPVAIATIEKTASRTKSSMPTANEWSGATKKYASTIVDRTVATKPGP
jgi:hypothetical protein